MYNQGQRIRKELTVSLGRFPQEREIANHLNISLTEWQETKLAAKNKIPLSIDAVTSNHVDSPVTWVEVLPCHHTTVSQQQEEEKQQLEEAMRMLDDNCRIAIKLVFVKELTRKDAAKNIGASPIKVASYLKKGLQDLMYYLQSGSVVTG